MDYAAWTVIALTLGVLVLLVLDRAPLDVIGIGLLVALVLTGVLDFQEAAAGFSNYVILTLAGLYVVGEGLNRTGAVEFIATRVLRYSRGSTTKLLFLVCLITAAVSSVLNNTGVVVIFIPLLLGVSRTTGIPASHLLMPMSFASILGGMCTLVGTSTNLLVSGVAVEKGLEGLGMFEMTPLGVILVVAGVAFMALTTTRILPHRTSLTMMMAEGSEREYVTELLIGPTSPLIGRPYKEVFADAGPRLLFFVRKEEMVRPPYFNETVQPGDAILLRGHVEEIIQLQEKLGLKFVHDVQVDPQEMRFYELAVSPHSSLLGHKVSDLRLHRDFGMVVVAVLRAGQHIHERASNLVLRPGDLLLVCGDRRNEPRLRASQDFFLIESGRERTHIKERARRALWVAGVVILLFSLKSLPDLPFLPEDRQLHHLIPVPHAALLGALLMVATGCLTARRAYRAIDWPILLFVIGTIALGDAMDETGVAAKAAQGILAVFEPYGPVAVVSALLAICILFNALISHAAVAVLLTPIAIAAGRAMGEHLAPEHAEPILRACVLAIAFGGSICFATPVGHQTNLMVYGPGGYKYADYLRLGLPLSLIVWILCSIGIPWMTGLL